VSKTLRALLVEDSLQDAELILSSLERHGFVVSSRRVCDAATMTTALADEIWDVIISDYLLPSFSGPKALEIYRKEGLDIPFVCVSGKIGEEEAAGMIRSGAHDFVSKEHLDRLALVIEMELNLTDRRRQQKQVAKSTRHLAAIVEGTDDGIIGKDLSGTILSWNKSAEVIFGYSAEEVIGKNISVIVPPEKSWEIPSILDQLQRGNRIQRMETVRQRKDGKLVDVSLTISPIQDDLGRVIGASTITRDISERHREEAERMKLIEDLERAMSQVEQLKALLPICARCKKIRDDKGVWQQLEAYFRVHSKVEFSHSLCPECCQQSHSELEAI
jgi:PAS domain S-box-containing protein